MVLDGWPAQGRERAARHFAQREPLRWRDVSAGSGQQGPADRCRVGAIPGEQRAAVRDAAAQGRIETHPALSPNDEFARHEILEYLLGGIDRAPRLHGSYIREAYQNGLAMQEARGYNPYRFGLVGASDTHGTAMAYTQSNFFGGHALLDATPQGRLSGEKHAGMTSDRFATSGLGGVWAEENTREAIFAAMQRKETFATSGVRIQVRFFGGWDFAPGVLQRKDWVRPGTRTAFRWAAICRRRNRRRRRSSWAVKDPDDANLDRIQIVKGWTRNGQIFEKIYNVAWSGNRAVKGGARISDALVRRGEAELPPVGNTVDVKNATYTNTSGAVELKQSGPTRTSIRASSRSTMPGCCRFRRRAGRRTTRKSSVSRRRPTFRRRFRIVRDVSDLVRRATARKAAKPGTTVAELKQQGAVALDDAQLKQLIVGKTFKIRNTVTAQRFEILYGLDGRRLILSVDGNQPPAGQIGDVLHSGGSGRRRSTRSAMARS